MQHVIIGYGYCGAFLAKYLMEQKQDITVVSRHEKYCLPGVKHIALDIALEPLPLSGDMTWYYMVPPQAHGVEDEILKKFLELNPQPKNKIIYFGSSGVYGNHHGNWVDEHSPCHIQFDRQKRRLHAELLWQQQAKHHVLLRIAGIYGPNRLPQEAAFTQKAIIQPDQAPWTNLIYVEDLVRIASNLIQDEHACGIYNVSDGQPCAMGTLQQTVATALQYPQPPMESHADAMVDASPMKKEFLISSKRLNTEKLNHQLQDKIFITPLKDAVNHSI